MWVGNETMCTVGYKNRAHKKKRNFQKLSMLNSTAHLSAATVANPQSSVRTDLKCVFSHNL